MIMERKEKGFTLVELLAVIVILAILALIAVPNVSSLVRKSKTNMFCKKVESIEAAAKNYAQDNFTDSLTEEETIIVDKIPLGVLVEKGYLNKDSKDCTIGTNCVLDERNNTYLDNHYVQIYSKNKRFYGRFLYDSADVNVCGNKITYHQNTYGTFDTVNLTNEKYGLDVNAKVNGTNIYNDLPVSFDVYIDGEKVKNNVSDYCVGTSSCSGSHPKNATYELRNIRVHSGYTCFVDTTIESSVAGVLTNTKSVYFNCTRK